MQQLSCIFIPIKERNTYCTMQCQVIFICLTVCFDKISTLRAILLVPLPLIHNKLSSIIYIPINTFGVFEFVLFFVQKINGYYRFKTESGFINHKRNVRAPGQLYDSQHYCINASPTMKSTIESAEVLTHSSAIFEPQNQRDT